MVFVPEGQHDRSQARSAWVWSFGHLQKVSPEFAPRRGWRAQPRVSTLGTDHVGSQVWVTLLSHYLGYTLSQHLGDSFRFAPRGQLSAHIVAPAKNFFSGVLRASFPRT
jgi:hypothetical protein